MGKLKLWHFIYMNPSNLAMLLMNRIFRYSYPLRNLVQMVLILLMLLRVHII